MVKKIKIKNKKKISYRKIWESHYGPIPRQEDGRSYEIHHIDGDRNNNDISNLLCLTIQEHYDIHYSQEDWHACLLIADRMKLDPATKSRLCSEATKKLFERGDHPFLDGKMSKSVQAQRIQDGTHHFLGGSIQRAVQLKLVENGIHHNLDGSATYKQLENGTHATQILVSCIYCHETVCKTSFGKDHGNKCWMVNSKNPVIINDVTYNSKKAAAKALNITVYQVSVLAKGKKPRPIFIYNGKEYRSVLAAMKETGLSRNDIEKVGEKMNNC